MGLFLNNLVTALVIQHYTCCSSSTNTTLCFAGRGRVSAGHTFRQGAALALSGPNGASGARSLHLPLPYVVTQPEREPGAV